jgi:O-antigen/teichoic acid export membrane protein
MSTTTSIPACISPSSTQRESANAWLSALRGTSGAWTSHYRGFLALCDQGVVSVTNFATGVVIGRACGRPELGVYTLAWTLVTLSTEVFGLLTTAPYTVFSPRLSKCRRRRYLGSVLVHQLLLSAIFASTIAAGAALGSWTAWLSNDLSTVIRTTAGAIVFIGLREFIRRISFADLRTGAALSIDVIACLAQVGGMLLLLRSGALSASRTLLLLGASSAVTAVGWLALNRRAFRLGARVCGRDFRSNWHFSKWVLGSGIVSIFARYLYPWILAAFHGTSVTGTWAACSAIVALGNPVLLGLSNHVLPNVSSVYAASGIEALKRYVHRSSFLFAVLLVPVVLLLAGRGERIVTGVYGATYAGSVGVLVLLALNMLVTSLANPYSQGLFSLERAKLDTLINLVCVMMLFTVGVAAVKYYAALGAAGALLTSSTASAILRVRGFSRETRRRS